MNPAEFVIRDKSAEMHTPAVPASQTVTHPAAQPVNNRRNKLISTP